MEIYNGTYCVYIHTNKINGKMYVGQTIHGDNPKRRWDNGNGYLTNQYFSRAIKKYGWDNFEHEIIASKLTKEEADNFEKLLIINLDTTNSSVGYNIALGGGGTLGVKKTEKEKQEHSQRMKEKCLDPEYIQMMRNVAPKRKVYQFTLAGDFVAEYESAMEAQRQTGIHNGDISKSAFGRVSHAKNYIFLFEEDKNDIAQRVDRYNNTKKLKHEPIVQLTLDNMFIREWPNPSQAGKSLGINYKNIHTVCRKARSHAGGFKWMYLSDYMKMCKEDNGNNFTVQN